MRNLSFILVLLLTACTSDISMREVPLDYLLNDNSSKVWLVDRVLDHGKNLAPERINFRDIMIFYKSGRVTVQTLNSLGNKEADSAYFFLQKDNSELHIQFVDKDWWFEVSTISLEKVVLKPKEKSDLPYELELIPLPEL